MSSVYNSQEKEELIQNLGFRQHFKAQQWSEFNRKFFNGLAPKYDFLNEVLTFGMQGRYKRKAMSRLDIRPGYSVLDIATGSGDMALIAAKKNPDARFVGVDVAENMLEIAERRTGDLDNVKFEYADALHLPFADDTFEVTLTSYGLRNYADLEQGVLEMIRVTKPGGQIMTVDLGKPRGWFNQNIYRLYFEKIVPTLGHYIFHRGEFNSFKYLPESNKFFPEPDKLKEILRGCGIKDIKTHQYMNGIVSQQIGYV